MRTNQDSTIHDYLAERFGVAVGIDLAEKGWDAEVDTVEMTAAGGIITKGTLAFHVANLELATVRKALFRAGVRTGRAVALPDMTRAQWWLIVESCTDLTKRGNNYVRASTFRNVVAGEWLAAG
jgi:hypothetical protein